MGVWAKFAALFGAGVPGLVPDGDNPLDPTKFLSQSGWVVPVSGLPNVVAASILASVTTVPTGTPTSISGGVSFDIGGFTSVTPTDVFTIPAIAGIEEGLYLITASCVVDDGAIVAAANSVSLMLVLTGISAGNRSEVISILDTDINSQQGLSTQFVVRMVEGDTVKAIVNQDGGADASILSGNFNIVLLGRVS